MIVGSAVVPLDEFLATSRGLSTAVLPVPPARFETISVDVIVAISTQRDQIFVCVVTQSASRANVVDLKTIGSPAVLASPAVTLQHFRTEFAIRIWV
jgi:hypothetical protein